ncbi:MAG: potassium channel family protein [Vampirovibrionales bacterium]|nr:potassium channel family protein [Vampirovibrionales bacterium]
MSLPITTLPSFPMPQILVQLLAGALLVGTTVVIHAVVLDNALRMLTFLMRSLKRHLSGGLWEIAASVLMVYVVLIAITVEVWLWATFFYLMGEPVLHSAETALYFSTATFTTLGFGDITLSPNWRLLASFEAANGLLVFGWSTAFLLEALGKIHSKED